MFRPCNLLTVDSPQRFQLPDLFQDRRELLHRNGKLPLPNYTHCVFFSPPEI